MKKLTLLSLFVSLSSFAEVETIFGPENLVAVKNSSPNIIKEYASGVCHLSITPEMKAGCSCFRIAEKLILTNYHCLASTHLDLKELNRFAPMMGSPAGYLYKFVNNTPPGIIERELLRTVGRTDVILPKNDDDLIIKMNQTVEKMGFVNFNHTIDHEEDLRLTSLPITKVLAVSETHDFLLLEVHRMKNENKILELSDEPVINNQNLVTIGHPAKSSFNAGMIKVFDYSNDCKIFDADAEGINDRIDNFAHGCDTYGGSSGSPIFDRESKKVVGLHWSGFNGLNYNRAIKIKPILEKINKFLK